MIRKTVVVATGLLLLASAGSYLVFVKGPSRQTYQARADAICLASAPHNRQIQAPTNLGQLDSGAEQLGKNMLATKSKMLALELPRRIDDMNVARLLSNLERSSKLALNLSYVVGNKDTITMKKSQGELAKGVSQFLDSAQEIGLRECGTSESEAAYILTSASIPKLVEGSMVPSKSRT